MKIESFNRVSNINGSYRKEKGYAGTYLVVDSEGIVKIDLRIYWTAHTCWACVWLVGGSGSGKAGGYGYDKESAAVWSAFKSAGVSISGLSGTGMIKEALELVATEMGLTNFKIFHTHP